MFGSSDAHSGYPGHGDILPRCLLLCKVTAWSNIFATLIGTFLVLSGFTKLLAINMPGVLSTWSSNIEHWLLLLSTSVLTMTFFGFWQDSYVT